MERIEVYDELESMKLGDTISNDKILKFKQEMIIENAEVDLKESRIHATPGMSHPILLPE